ALLLCGRRPIRREHLGPALQKGSHPAGLGQGSYAEQMAALEREVIRIALDRASWNRSHAARALGLPVRTLRRKIDALRLDAPPGRRGRPAGSPARSPSGAVR